MKYQDSFKTMFGASTHDMAMILGVTDGQYSMFDCGKRNLPNEELALLGEMLAHMKKMPESGTLNGKHLIPFLKSELDRTERQYYLTIKKMAAAKKKVTATEKVRHLSSLILEMAERNDKRRQPILNPFHTQTKDYYWQKLEIDLLRLKLKLELLGEEKKILEARITAIQGSPEDGKA
ncbi:hypothetical protein [Flavobacterium silvaticum]|uniref:Uncharacterized protein n=1 Tax=Flavobacterium silvaticum TaxID=1852020 RepID=A0A972JHT2_9FLAO|nr:hypothetical protein [Flavobacterium silvaticum]NMH29561.1 hypothetical protein [Flavobacterium silvaticum]